MTYLLYAALIIAGILLIATQIGRYLGIAMIIGLLAIRYSDQIIPGQYPDSCRRWSYASDPLSTVQNYLCQWMQHR